MSPFILAAIIHLSSGAQCGAVAVCAPSDANPASIMCEVVLIDSCPELTLPACLQEAEVQILDTYHDVLGCTPDARTLTIDLEGT